MKVTGGNQDLAAFNRAAVDCFLGRQFARGVKALREQTGKERRHVLHNEDGQCEVSRKRRQDCAQGGRSSSGYADYDHLRPQLHGLREWRTSSGRRRRRNEDRFFWRSDVNLFRQAEKLPRPEMLQVKVVVSCEQCSGTGKLANGSRCGYCDGRGTLWVVELRPEFQ